MSEGRGIEKGEAIVTPTKPFGLGIDVSFDLTVHVQHSVFAFADHFPEWQTHNNEVL